MLKHKVATKRVKKLPIDDIREIGEAIVAIRKYMDEYGYETTIISKNGIEFYLDNPIRILLDSLNQT